MKIAILNLSGATNDQVGYITEALRYYSDAVCCAWERITASVEFFPEAKVAPAGYIPLVALDHPDVANAEGYHDRDPQGRAYGRAFLNTVPGKTVMHDPSGHGQSLSGVMSHEFAEIVGDEYACFYSDGPLRDPGTGKSWSQVALELCDPVQSSGTSYATAGGPADLSNFVLPSWFNAADKSGVYDWCGVLKSPLSLDRGGYCIARDSSGEEQIFRRKKVIIPDFPPSRWRNEMQAVARSRSHARMVKL